MKFSIVTINYNNLAGLKKTRESIISQTCKNYEWIVIDGGSTDGAKEFLQEHSNEMSYWCSEKDKGVYNAQNKGIALAKGDYMICMNSGDCTTKTANCAKNRAKILSSQNLFINLQTSNISVKKEILQQLNIISIL